MLSLGIAILILVMLVVVVTVVMVRIRIPECPKCPDIGNLPTFDCNNCTIPEPDCSMCPADLLKCRSTFPPDCTQCPTDCIKANSDPLCAPDCPKCAARCPVDLAKCRDALDNLYYSADKVDLPELLYAQANVPVNNLVEGRFGFSIRFKPSSKYGILCAFVEPTFVLMYLLGGKIRLLVTSSDQSYDDFPVDTQVSLGQISTVALTTSPGSTNVLVTVNATQRTIQAPTPIKLASKMFLGGVPNDNLVGVPRVARSNFKGCIFEVKSASDTPLDLTKFTRSNVDLGCQ